MGTFVSGAIVQSKQGLDVSTPAAAAISLTAGDAGVFLGTALATKRLTGLKRLQQCRDRARELGYPIPSAANSTQMDKDSGKVGVVLAGGAAAPVLTEDDVMVIWSDTFQTDAQAKSLIFDTFLTNCIDRLKEELVAT